MAIDSETREAITTALFRNDQLGLFSQLNDRQGHDRRVVSTWALKVACEMDCGWPAIYICVGQSADVNVKFCRDGRTVLHKLCEDNCTDSMLEYILEHGADTSMVDSLKNTPLMSLCGSNDPTKGAVRLLHQYGADLEVVGEYGFTPLCMACQCNNDEAALELVELGANISFTDSKGMTPIALARENGNEGLALALEGALNDSFINLMEDDDEDDEDVDDDEIEDPVDVAEETTDDEEDDDEEEEEEE